ncbi:hypothetical protein PG988_000203 [Apiospora saccharicola]
MASVNTTNRNDPQVEFPTGRAHAPSSSSQRQRPHCRCQVIKKFRFDCGHTELLRAGPQPYCLLNGLCAEVGDVRELLCLAGPRCLSCHAQHQYQITHPDASRAALKSESRRALKQSRLLPEQRACEQLLTTSQAKTKLFLGKKRRAHVIGRVEKALRYVVLYKYRPVGGPLQHDGEILYRLAAEVFHIYQHLGPDADRLMEMFGQLVTAYDEKWAKHLKTYVRALGDDRLSQVYNEAFRVQQPRSYGLRKRRERRNAAREQWREVRSEAGKQENEQQPPAAEMVEHDQTPNTQDQQVDPTVLEVECKHATNSGVAIPQPGYEAECLPEEAPEAPLTPELPPLPTLSANQDVLVGQEPITSWADECEDLDVWN